MILYVWDLSAGISSSLSIMCKAILNSLHQLSQHKAGSAATFSCKPGQKWFYYAQRIINRMIFNISPANRNSIYSAFYDKERSLI